MPPDTLVSAPRAMMDIVKFQIWTRPQPRAAFKISIVDCAIKCLQQRCLDADTFLTVRFWLKGNPEQENKWNDCCDVKVTEQHRITS